MNTSIAAAPAIELMPDDENDNHHNNKPPQNTRELRKWLLDHDQIDTRNLNTWIPKLVAAELLGLNERTIERRIADGLIEKRQRPLPGSGRKALPILNPRDVRRILLKSMPQATATRLEPEMTEAIALAAAPSPAEYLAATFAALSGRLPPPAPPLFMDLDTAVEQSGVREHLRPLFRKLLVKAIKSGELPARKVSRVYFVHREDLLEFGRRKPG